MKHAVCVYLTVVLLDSGHNWLRFAHKVPSKLPCQEQMMLYVFIEPIPATNENNYTTFTNFSMKYHLMCKVYTEVSGIK